MLLEHWSVALNHVTRPCRREVAHAFVAADVAFPSVTRPVIFKASGTCNGEIFEALRKYFYYGKQTPRAAEHNTVEMDYPDLSFFEQLYGETGGHLNNIKSDDKDAINTIKPLQSSVNILYEVTELIPNECREETGLLFDVAVGESLDIGFVDGKKNFKITEKCSEYSYSALEIFFTSLRSLEAFAFKEDLVEKSKLLQLIDEWKQSKVLYSNNNS
nr:unnamed protein product [Callosobruchus chinensis]